MIIKIKRAYAQSSKDDGYRILIDKFWPRGLTKEKAQVNLWLKYIAPSDNLRKWFDHDKSKWEEFKTSYWHELDLGKSKTKLQRIRKRFKKETITLVYGAKEEKYNNAVALKEYIENLSQ